jgi:hypothetical protein
MLILKDLRKITKCPDSPTEIQAGYLLSTNPARCWCASLFVFYCFGVVIDEVGRSSDTFEWFWMRSYRSGLVLHAARSVSVWGHCVAQ